MASRIKMISKPTKKSVQKSSFGLIRKLPTDTFYKNINDNLFKDFITGSESREYPSLNEVPILKPLIDVMKDDIKAPGDVSPTVWIGVYTRDNETFIQPPPKTCALRILVNLGYGDTYHFLPRYKVKESKETVDSVTKQTKITVTEKFVDSGLDENETHLEANSYAVLGPINHCDYLIKVNKNPKITIPAKMPNEAPKTTRRARDYKRITIVFDYLATLDIINNLTNLVNSANIPKLKVNAGASPKVMEAQMKKLQNSIAQDSMFKKQVDDVMNAGTKDKNKDKDKKGDGENKGDNGEVDIDSLENAVSLSLEQDKAVEMEKKIAQDILEEMESLK